MQARKIALRGNLAPPPAKARQALIEWVQEEGFRSASQASPAAFRGHVAEATGFTAVQVKQWAKPEHQRRLELWLEAQQALRNARIGKKRIV